MASDKDAKKLPKKPETVRERAERAINEASKPSKQTIEPSDVGPTKSKRRFGRSKKEKKSRRFHIIPSYFRNSVSELKKVSWPNRRDTVKLTTAVIIFSITFSALVSGVDYVFSIIFKKVFLHG